MVLIDWRWFVLLIGMYPSIGRPVFQHRNSGLHGQRDRSKLVASLARRLYHCSAPVLAEQTGEWPGEVPKLEGAISDPLRGGLGGICLVHRKVSSIVWYDIQGEGKRETARKN